MKSKDTTQRVLNWSMVVCLVLMFISQATSMVLHIALGVVFLVLLSIHVVRYAKWVKVSTKSFLNKKLKSKTKTKYLIICGMLVAFGLVFISGVASAYELIAFGDVSEGLRNAGGEGFSFQRGGASLAHRVHTIFAFAGVLLAVPHLAAWFAKRKKATTRRAQN